MTIETYIPPGERVREFYRLQGEARKLEQVVQYFLDRHNIVCAELGDFCSCETIIDDLRAL